MTTPTPVYVHTSYYGNARHFPDNHMIVVCSRSFPMFFDEQVNIVSWKEIAPTKQILNAYKVATSQNTQPFLSKEIQVRCIKEYIRDYVEYVLIPYQRIEEDFWRLQKTADAMGVQHIFICCYERIRSFCHRRVWAEYMKQRYGYSINEYLETKERPDGYLEEWIAQIIETEVREILKRRMLLS